MPAVIPLVITAVLGQTALAIALQIGATIAIGLYQRSRAKKKAKAAFNASLEDRFISVSTADGSRSRLYGRVRNSDGIIFKGTYGTNKEKFMIVVALAGHEVDGIETVYFNDVPLGLVSDGVSVAGGVGVGYLVTTAPYMQTQLITAETSVNISAGGGSITLPFTPIAGSVSLTLPTPGDDGHFGGTPSVSGNTVTFSGVFPDGNWILNYQYIQENPKAKIWKCNGSPGQDLSQLLQSRFPTIISSTDRFDGIALLAVELTYNQDAFPQGVPSITAVVRGAKVADPRNGSVAWTENPALIARDWALHPNGGGALADEIVDSSFIAAANACDVVTTFELAGTVTETRPLYQCGIVCPLDGSPDEFFAEMIESMAGKWAWSSGRLIVTAGVWRAPVAAINDTWVTDAEDIVIIKDISRNEAVNVYRPKIANADGYVDGVSGPKTSVAYTVTPAPEVRSNVFITEDGQELVSELALGGVTRNVHAQHIAGVMMRDSRDGMIVKLPCNMKAWHLELFDTVTLTLDHFGFVDKQFEILGWRYTVDNGVQLTMKETAASIYNPASGLSSLNAVPNTSLPVPWLVAQLFITSVVTGTAALEDGTSQTRVTVTWGQSPDESVRQSGKIEVQYTPATEALPIGDWPSVITEGGATSVTISGLLAGTAYVFRIRAVNTLGVRGAWSIQKTQVISVPPAAANAAAAAAAAAAALARVNEIISDSLLTPNEKILVIQDRDVIVNEQAGIDARATAVGITTEKAAYDTAISNLTSYLATLTSPVAWDNLSGNTNIVGGTFRQYFNDVYSARQTLLNKISESIAAAAAAASAAASAAQSSANAALASISNLSSDNILSQIEKPSLVLEVTNINNEVSDIVSKAGLQGITTELSNYQAAYNALVSYLAGLTSPVSWDNISGDTTIVGTTFRSNFASYYANRQNLLNLIAVRIANGSVGTEQLAPSAATEVAASSATGLSFTAPSSDPRGTRVFSICSVTYTNSGSVGIVLECTGGVSGTFSPTSGGINVAFAIYAMVNSTTVASPNGVSRNTLMPFYPAGSTAQILSGSVVWQYSLASGSTITIDLVTTCDIASSVNGSLRVAAIKR